MRPRLLTCLSLCLAAFAPLGAQGKMNHPDHYEFEAALSVPFQGRQGDARMIQILLQFPGAEPFTFGAWRLELRSPAGRILRTWHGETLLTEGLASVKLPWDGKDLAQQPLPAGFYSLRLAAAPMPLKEFQTASGTTAEARVQNLLAFKGADEIQEISLQVGHPARPSLRPFTPLRRAKEAVRDGSPTVMGAAAAPGALPFTVVLGNLHSQTNHSDGGSVVSACSGSEVPQGGTQGPGDAFEMMRVQAGGDFLLTSEHNHMFDGSTSTNAAADPATCKALFASGLAIAAGYRNTHPDFLALYGLEWGVISGGGHLNILNPDGLATWESNGAGQLLGDYFTPKSDYPTLYSFMKPKGWIGQFNHPQSTQFGNLVYTADGDEVMALCEVMNTSAFSKNLTESETSRSFYESTWNRLLEAGYHVAPSTDQDNHCANWGLSYSNRTGLLLPLGTAVTFPAFLDAVKARRVFATMDKGSQIVLTTGAGALMGDRISHSGALTLHVGYATATPGRSAARVQIMEGVPGRNGTVTQLQEGSDTITFTPGSGAHFYYAIVTQDNGDKLWSAPLWVQQQSGPVTADILQPTGSITVDSGATVAFQGSATTTNAAITAQSWTFGDGASAAGATASHTFTNAGSTLLSYTATFSATDDTGATGLASRVVTVNPGVAANTAPTISAIPDQSGLKNLPFPALSFTVGDAQTPAASLAVGATSSNPTLFPAGSLVLEGSGSVRSLTLTPAPDQTGLATLTVTVTDAQGASTATAFKATVRAQDTGQARLILSQYYEGLSFDKWIEITNVGGGTYDATLTPLYLGLWANPYTNGTTYAATPITGTLAPGESRLYKNSAAVLPEATHLTGTGTPNNSVINYNGDDISFITPVAAAGKAGYDARVDAIGENTAFWATSVSGGYGKDRSFVRNFNIVKPNALYTPAEWTPKSLAEVNGAAATLSERLGVHRYNTPPTLTDLPQQHLQANTTLGPVAFTVGDADTLADALVVGVTSSNPTLVPQANLRLGGSGADRTLTLTPAPDESGTAVITLTVTDAQGLSTTDTFVLTVDAPISTITGVSVSPASVFLNPGEETQFQATVTGTYTFSHAVTWERTGGSVDATGHYTAPGQGGTYAVTARSVQDPSQTGTAEVRVNFAPVATGQNVVVPQDGALAIVLAGSDAEGAALSYEVAAQPLHGTLTGPAPNLTYQAAPGYFGADAFTFTVNDGRLNSAPATVQIQVDGRPTAFPLAVSTDKGHEVATPLLGTDPENEPLAYTIVAAPQHGTLSGQAPNLVYTPAGKYFGLDRFTYIVNDGRQLSAPAAVSITINPGRHNGQY